MRDLDQAEADALSRGQCPFCAGDRFREGRPGGLAVNWFCLNCGAGFSLPPVLTLRSLARTIHWSGQLIQEPEPPASQAVLPDVSRD